MELQLGIAGRRVTEVAVEFTITVRFGAPVEFELQIEGDPTLRTSNGHLLSVTAENYSDISSELESLVGSTVTRADASEVDGLSLEFDSGAAMRVPVHEKYESWGLVGIDGSRVICLPGGEFAIWSARE
ncbi:DUF6188 family protein [Nocardia brasiliensis]|uniref:DUF6188 family protein n=1 Tax=Nocardia brasiliensis TaxID=37326 RepID=UPI003D9264B4